MVSAFGAALRQLHSDAAAVPVIQAGAATRPESPERHVQDRRTLAQSTAWPAHSCRGPLGPCFRPLSCGRPDGVSTERWALRSPLAEASRLRRLV